MTVPRIGRDDSGTTLQERVRAIVESMSLEEKLAQLGSEWAFKLLDPDGEIDRDAAASILGNGIGQITRVGGSTLRDPSGVAHAVNELQRYLIEETRLGIPAIVHEETLHGVLARGATIFQQSIGAAATWDPDLVRQVADTIRRRMLLMGARHALAPVLDITTDPRWGQIEETYGEDPYLATAMRHPHRRRADRLSLAV
jgi:beta-glucosidase